MALFKDMLASGESVFKNELALDFEFLPKLLPYRENQQQYLATCIKPLFQDRGGRNLLIHGPPGIGKTAAMKFVFRDLEEETDEVIPLYVNCWQKNTTYKVLVELCHLLGYKFTQNKKTEELFKVVREISNKSKVVFAFDEVDKLEDTDFLYSIAEEVYKKTVFMITNHKQWIVELDPRVKSRLNPEMLGFEQYNPEETKGILKDRLNYAFVPGVWEDDAFNLIAQKTAEIRDVRTGLHMLKNAGLAAEDKGSKKIKLEHAQTAVGKVEEMLIKNPEELDNETKEILEIVKEHSNKKIGELFKVYQEKGGKQTYKTFQRKIDKLQKNSFVSVEKTQGGKEGNTTFVSYEKHKKITDF